MLSLCTPAMSARGLRRVAARREAAKLPWLMRPVDSSRAAISASTCAVSTRVSSVAWRMPGSVSWVMTLSTNQAARPTTRK